MTIQQALGNKSNLLTESGIKTGELDCLILLELATSFDRAHLLAHSDQELTKPEQQKFDQLISQRARHTPIAYLTGHKEFYDLDFLVTPDVLIPRPETEALVGLALKLGPHYSSLIDVGTGSGCIAVALAKQRPAWHILASDISAKALAIARQNAKRHKVKIDLVRSDLLTKINNKFDLIIANLPYLPLNYPSDQDLAFEPRLALNGGQDGLDLYCRLFSQAPKQLNQGCWLLIEALPIQQPKLIKLAKTSGLSRELQTELVLGFRLATR